MKCHALSREQRPYARKVKKRERGINMGSRGYVSLSPVTARDTPASLGPPVHPHGVPDEPVVDVWGSAIPVENVQPCSQCKSLELWQDFDGGWHCIHCEHEGLALSRRLARKTRRVQLKASAR